MKRILILLIVLGLFVQDAVAQSKMLSVADVAGYSLYPARKSYTWLPIGTKISSLETVDDETYLVTQNLMNGINDTVMSLSDINIALDDMHMDISLKRFPNFKWLDNYIIQFSHKGIYYNFNSLTKTILLAGAVNLEGEFTEVHQPTLNSAYSKDDNLIIKTNDLERKITYDGGNGIVYGQAVHRFEFGISKGLFWSPNGSKLAFYRKDENSVTDYPIYDLTTNPATHRNIKYPTAGDSSHTVTLGIYDIEESTILYLDTDGSYDQYLTNITWSPNGEYIYIAWVNREQNHMKLQRYDAATGQLDKVLLEEKNDRYVEPEHGPMFLKTDENKFVWFSERDGYNHLYLYNTKGKMLNQLTSGKWIVTEIIGFDKTDEHIFFMGTKNSPLERHLYKVNIKTGDIKKITKNAGTHSISMNSDATKFIDIFSSTKTPRETRIIDVYGEILKVIHQSKNPLEEYAIGDIKIEPLVKGNTVYYQRIVYPPSFDPNKKYPAIVYLYGGPHSQQISNRWLGGARMEFLYWAQQGYIVYTIDNRGSANRGFEFESAVHRQLGTLEMEDQLSGINYLKNLPYIDKNRLGIHGWSFGGFMTTSMMSRNPGIFKVGVAGGPVIDWDYYEVMYTERYMDTPEENPEGYEKANLLNYVNDLEGRLLMIHGTDDDVVLWQHSMLYIQKAVDNNVLNLDYYIYPNHKHNVRGKDREHLIGKISQYLFEHL